MFRDNVKVMMFNNGKDKEKEMAFKALKAKGLKGFWIYNDISTAKKVEDIETSKPSEKGIRLAVEKDGKKYIVESTLNYEVLTTDGFKPLEEIKKGDKVKFFALSGAVKDVEVVTCGKKEFKGDSEMYDTDTDMVIVNHLYYKKKV